MFSHACRLYHILTIVSFLGSLARQVFAIDADDEPQTVVIQSNESWQNGVVLIYSTILLIGLRLPATIRHSPISPLRASVLRIHLYAVAMFAIGSISSLTLLLLSVFPATRDTARELMPCASPLLAVGAILALYPQTTPPQWDAQQITALIGTPNWLAFCAAFIFNGMTISASVLNGAWAATSISIATTLVAIFGPRTPVVQRTLANGIVEAGGPLIFKVRNYGEKAIIALSFWEFGSVTRVLIGRSWTNLQSIDQFGHDRPLRIGAFPVVSKIMVDDDKCTHLQLISQRDRHKEKYVELISGETSEVLGYMPLEEWLKAPFGDDVLAVQICMDSLTMQLLSAKIWSACLKTVENEFPGAAETYWTILRRILEPVPRPDHGVLDLMPGTIDLSAEMGVNLDEYARCIMKVEELTEDLPQPHRNILRVVLTAKFSKHYDIHVDEVIDMVLDAAAGVISGDCVTLNGMFTGDRELCVIFDGIDDDLVEFDEIHAVVTSKERKTAHWIQNSERDKLDDYLNKNTHNIIVSDTSQSIDVTRQVEAMRLRKTTGGKLELISGEIAAQTSRMRPESNGVMNEDEWNAVRLRNPQYLWPLNWERGEPASRIAKVKGMAEIASLQAITSGIAAGSVLFSTLLGT